MLYAGLPNPRAALEALVGPLAEFTLDVIEMPGETARPEPPPIPQRAERPLRPLAAALAAEAHLLATADPTERRPDMLGFAGVYRLMVA